MYDRVDAKIEGIPEQRPRVVYHGTSAGAIEMVTRGGPPYELVSLGALIDKGIVPLGGEITRGGLTIKGVNQDRISTAETMERPLSYALGEHEERAKTPMQYMIKQQAEIIREIKNMDTASKGGPWPVRRMFYTTGLKIVVAMMRLRQINPKGPRILNAKLRAVLKTTRVPSYREILDWFRQVVMKSLAPYQDLLRASEMDISDVIAEFSNRSITPRKASAWSSTYAHLPKFIRELKSRPDNILLLYAISLDDDNDETKVRMVKEVQKRLDRYGTNVSRIIRLAERAFDFDTRVPFDATGFPFDLMNVPVIIKTKVTQYTVNPDEITVYETIDLSKATIYHFAKDVPILRDRSSWFGRGEYSTEPLYLSDDPERTMDSGSKTFVF